MQQMRARKRDNGGIKTWRPKASIILESATKSSRGARWGEGGGAEEEKGRSMSMKHRAKRTCTQQRDMLPVSPAMGERHDKLRFNVFKCGASAGGQDSPLSRENIVFLKNFHFVF
jgi:hypothetical protein